MSAANLSTASADASISSKAKPKGKSKGTASNQAKSARTKAPAKSQTKKIQPKATKKVAPKTKATRRPAPVTKLKPLSKTKARIWTACFVYANAARTANIAIRRIRARDDEKAKEIALKAPPGEEFMLTIVPESDEQFLGQVRLKALTTAENRA